MYVRVSTSVTLRWFLVSGAEIPGLGRCPTEALPERFLTHVSHLQGALVALSGRISLSLVCAVSTQPGPLLTWEAYQLQSQGQSQWCQLL